MRSRPTSAFPELAPLTDTSHGDALLGGEVACAPGCSSTARVIRDAVTLTIFDLLRPDGQAGVGRHLLSHPPVPRL